MLTINVPDAALERLKEALSATTQAELASALGLSAPSISCAARRYTLPLGWLERAHERGVDVCNVLFGQTAVAPPRPAEVAAQTAPCTQVNPAANSGVPVNSLPADEPAPEDFNLINPLG